MHPLVPADNVVNISLTLCMRIVANTLSPTPDDGSSTRSKGWSGEMHNTSPQPMKDLIKELRDYLHGVINATGCEAFEFRRGLLIHCNGETDVGWRLEGKSRGAIDQQRRQGSSSICYRCCCRQRL